jgi:predicted DNA-binding mobile mystery protein A
MMNKYNKLTRQQLEITLQKFRSLLNIQMPPKGWIRAVRDSLGMNGRQLADRLNVTRQRASMIEKDELGGSATLKTMRRVAESLDCVFVYALVPRESLEHTLHEQARLVVNKQLARVSHTMMLENQELSDSDQEQARNDLVKELIETQPSTLWDKHDKS